MAIDSEYVRLWGVVLPELQMRRAWALLRGRKRDAEATAESIAQVERAMRRRLEGEDMPIRVVTKRRLAVLEETAFGIPVPKELQTDETTVEVDASYYQELQEQERRERRNRPPETVARRTRAW